MSVIIENVNWSPSICWPPQFNGKTNNIGWPTNEMGHTDLSILVVTLSTAVFFLLSA